MPYCVLGRGPQELYAMITALSEDEAQQNGSEGQLTVVTAIFVWTSSEGLEDFRQFLSIEKDNPNSPLRELIEDTQGGRVDELELSSWELRDKLRRYERSVGFVAIDPGPEQRVRKIDEFLAQLEESSES